MLRKPPGGDGAAHVVVADGGVVAFGPKEPFGEGDLDGVAGAGGGLNLVVHFVEFGFEADGQREIGEGDEVGRRCLLLHGGGGDDEMGGEVVESGGMLKLSRVPVVVEVFVATGANEGGSRVDATDRFADGLCKVRNARNGRIADLEFPPQFVAQFPG